MRKALNDNPLVQVGALAALALLVGFLLITRMSHKSSDTSTTSTTSGSTAQSSVAPTSSSSDTGAATPASTTPDPTATAPATASPSSSGSAAAGATGKFVAGPGLPVPVVNAYDANRVIVLLVVRRNGIDDDAVKSSVEKVAGQDNVALFVTNAAHVSRYSRIAAGVHLDRVPALIVLRPRNLSYGTPTALVSYGFRGPESVQQAVHDATYKGPTNVPYYPR